MNNKQKIQVNDFNLFVDLIQCTKKIVDSAKLQINENGVEIYGTRGQFTRCEMISNAISSKEAVEVSIQDLNMFHKVLTIVKDVHENDYSDFSFDIALPKISFSSKRFKTKYQTQDPDIISQWIGKKVETELKPEFEFSTNIDLVKKVSNKSFIEKDEKKLRIYIGTNDEMEKNVVYATLKNKDTELSNEMVVKFALVTFGKLAENRNIILDLEHLNLFTAFPNSDIKIFVPEKYNMLVGKSKAIGKNDTFFSMTIYNAILKS